MKKLALTLAIVLSLTSCSKDDNNGVKTCNCELVKEKSLYNPATGVANPWQVSDVVNPTYSNDCGTNGTLSNNQTESIPNTTLVFLTRYRVKCN